MTDNLLVSIIVRTKDRPELLKRALQSIAAQTYGPIEVILVNDGGCDLRGEELKEILPDVLLNYIRLEKNTGRAHAGNVGIENAKGDYIGFLDDDDEFYREHVATLVSAMKRSDYKIAYTAVEFVERTFDSGALQFTDIKKGLFAKDLSYNDLLIANYIPLISLLFKSDVLKNLMFDETFDLYEDWDMLIRASEKNEFYFINKITAQYNQWSSSQIAFKSSPEIIRQATIKLYKKHRAKIPIEFIFDMREKSARKDAVIAEKDEYIRKLESHNSKLEKALGEKDAYIRNLQSARGWRLLTKYYKIKNRFS